MITHNVLVLLCRKV